METTVNEIYPRVQKLKYDLQQQLREVEARRMSPSDMQLGLDTISMQCDQLETLAEREVKRRDEWRRKIKDIRDTESWLYDQLRRWRAHHDTAALENVERMELLGRNRIPQSVLSALDEEGQSYGRSQTKMAGLLETAGASIVELANQRDMLKGTHRRVLDMLTTLGVSSSTIRIIERRNVVDKMVVWAGIVVSSLMLCIVFRGTHGGWQAGEGGLG